MILCNHVTWSTFCTGHCDHHSTMRIIPCVKFPKSQRMMHFHAEFFLTTEPCNMRSHHLHLATLLCLSTREAVCLGQRSPILVLSGQLTRPKKATWHANSGRSPCQFFKPCCITLPRSKQQKQNLFKKQLFFLGKEKPTIPSCVDGLVGDDKHWPCLLVMELRKEEGFAGTLPSPQQRQLVARRVGTEWVWHGFAIERSWGPSLCPTCWWKLSPLRWCFSTFSAVLCLSVMEPRTGNWQFRVWRSCWRAKPRHRQHWPITKPTTLFRKKHRWLVNAAIDYEYQPDGPTHCDAGWSAGPCLLDPRFANECCLVHLHKVWLCIYFFRGHLVTSPQKANLNVSAVKKKIRQFNWNDRKHWCLAGRSGRWARHCPTNGLALCCRRLKQANGEMILTTSSKSGPCISC